MDERVLVTSDASWEEAATVMYELAAREAPQLFAVVEEYDESEGIRVAGYGLAYVDRAEVESTEGDFRLSAESAESARALFEIGSRSSGARRVHLVWLASATSASPPPT